MPTRVDFYQLSRDPVELTVAKLATKATAAGHRLLVIAEHAELRQRISEALWAYGKSDFLAHGDADAAHAPRQPIVLSATCAAPNDATIAIVADGAWRSECGAFERVMLLFDAQATDAARDVWRELAGREDIDNRIFKQTAAGGWREGR